ncbi:unnamed protein product [Dimorphilus gyrociliatus]|uniref:Calponin-homology (CH) domain-containing protein n=1 Tax=Dimorphilus gyrociliatus TaxID=2664684 RepID=A0A7I8WBU4_9ANNE|nr:unnamed protein product [Dimorphilus gyrociliatus]
MEILSADIIQEFNDLTLRALYAWIDGIPISKPKRNFARDFSDGVMAAEIIKHFFPLLVELHNYTPANGTRTKESNWTVLNRKVLSRLKIQVDPDLIRQIAQCKARAAESFLLCLKRRVEATMAEYGPNFSVYTKLKAEPTTKGKKAHNNYNVSNNTNNQFEMEPKSFEREIPKQQLIDKEEEIRRRDETIKVLQAKVNKLEQLLQLKELRIEDLTTRLKNTKGVQII